MGIWDMIGKCDISYQLIKVNHQINQIDNRIYRRDNNIYRHDYENSYETREFYLIAT